MQKNLTTCRIGLQVHSTLDHKNFEVVDRQNKGDVLDVVGKLIPNHSIRFDRFHPRSTLHDRGRGHVHVRDGHDARDHFHGDGDRVRDDHAGGHGYDRAHSGRVHDRVHDRAHDRVHDRVHDRAHDRAHGDHVCDVCAPSCDPCSV